MAQTCVLINARRAWDGARAHRAEDGHRRTRACGGPPSRGPERGFKARQSVRASSASFHILWIDLTHPQAEASAGCSQSAPSPTRRYQTVCPIVSSDRSGRRRQRQRCFQCLWVRCSRASMARLAPRSFSKDYGGTEAVREVSLDVAEGQLIAFLGPSWCGSTSTNELPPEERDVVLVFEDSTTAGRPA